MTVPQCANCKAKFQHDKRLLCCKQCGIPDEVVREGPRAVRRWRRKPYRLVAADSGVVTMEPYEAAPVKRQPRLRRKHGRTTRVPRRKSA